MSVFTRKGKRIRSVLCLVLAVCLLLGQIPYTAAASSAQAITLGIDTAKGNQGGMTIHNGNGRYEFYLTGLSDHVSWNETQTILIDGTEHSGKGEDGIWYDGQMLYITYAFLGISTGGEITKTFTIPAGTVIGDAVTQNTLSFTVNGWNNLTVESDAPSKTVNLSFSSGTWQVSDNRYLVWLEDDLADTPTVAWAAYSVLTVDGADQNVYATVDNGKIMLVLDSFAGFTGQAEHTVTVKKGTFIGDYEIANDVTFYTHADGTVSADAPSETVNLSFSSGTWQVSDNRYLAYLDHDLGKNLDVAWAPLDILTVDGADARVYATGGSQIMLVLDSFAGFTSQAEHTVTVKKGTFIGDYEIANDVTFYTHADGTVSADAPSKTVNLSFSSGTWQVSENRYLVWLEDDLADTPTVAWTAYSVLTVDGADQNVYATVDDGKIMLVLDSFAGFTGQAEHTVTVKKGTFIGDYEIANDVTFYTHANGTVDLDPPAAPVNFRFDSGIWQTANNRYLVWLEDDLADTPTVAWTAYSVLTVDGADQNVYATVDNGKIMLVLDTYAGIAAQGEHEVTLKKGTSIGDYEIANDVTFYTHADGTVDTEAPSNTVGLTFASGTWQPENNRYLAYLNHDLGKNLDVAWAPLDILSVDGTDAQVYALGGEQLMLVLDSFTGITAQGEHEITVKKGTSIGDYEIANDVTFYTHADGTVDMEEPGSMVGLTFASGTWQPENNRYLAYLNHDLGKNLDVAWAPLDILSVDGSDAQVYALGGEQLMLVLDSVAGFTGQAEHIVTVKKGTFIGDYEIANDVTFYTHADGTVSTDSPNQTLHLSFASGTWQADSNRYLAYLNHDLGKNLDVAWAPLDILSVDGSDAQVYALGGEQLMLVLDSFTGITAKGEHAITVKQGTHIGNYEIASDVTFYTYVDGSMGTTPPAEPVEFRFEKGSWQYIPENGLARYLVWLEADLDSIDTIPWAPLDGATVNGEKKDVYATLDSGMVLLILDEATGITQPGKYAVTLQKGSYIGKYELAKEITFYTDGLTVSTDAPVQIPAPSETVSVENDSRNLNSSCTTGFYFQVSPADQLPYDETNGTVSYSAAKGGIYVNGKLTPVTVTKWLENLYYVPLDVFGYTPKKGDVVAVDGVFGNGDHAVTFTKQSFVYDGNGNWDIGTYLRDLREKEYIVQDISELKMGLSEFKLDTGEALIGTASRSTNIAIRSIVSVNLDAAEFNFGFSKIDGMWDVQKSGWQVWLRPKYNQVFLAHGTSEWQATNYYEFTKEQFTVEFGTVDMHEYINGKDMGLYCRKIFVKIDGVEVLSYKDTDLHRNVGKKLFVYNSEDTVDAKLISLTSEGVTLREMDPKVYDYFDLTGFTTDTVPGGSTVCLGQTGASTNVGVRMKMDLSTKATEVRLALSKQQADNFWDAAGSGWQVWLRPRWDMLYIAHGENDFEVIMGYDFSRSFTLEFGTRDVVLEKDGKYVSTYCRKVYVKIDGKEVASWEDTDFGRPLGKNVMLLNSMDSTAAVSTLKKTATLPVEILVNGEAVENCEFLKFDPQVVVGEDNKISLIYSSDAANKIIFGGLYRNGEKLEPLEENGGKVSYLLDNASGDDRLKVELTARELTVEEPTQVFDLFNVAGKDALEVPAHTTVSIGAMVTEAGPAAVNSAVRFAIRIPKVFNQAQITILGDTDSPWSNSGAMLQITPNQVNLCHPAMVRRMASFPSDLFAPGSLVCVEFGIVKCYENGIYKYDRWYVKAGKTAEEMSLVGWYDSVERGHYGAHFVCQGSDMEQSYYLYSMKDVYSLKDESSAENKALLRTYRQLGMDRPELYYPEALVGYATLDRAEKAGRISLYTKPGTKLERLTVNGQAVEVTVGLDGAYSYTLPSVTGDIRFAYEITADDTYYPVTAGGDKLTFGIPEEGVLAGDDLVFTVTAQKGYVPQVTANGTQVSLAVNEETGVWQGTVKSVRQAVELVGQAVERSYILSVTDPDHGKLTLGGDVLDGKLPFGGKLELTLVPDSGYYIQSVLVNGTELPVDENGTVTVDAVYWDTQSITVEALLAKANAAQQTPEQSGPAWIWIGLAVVAAAAVGLGVGLRKRKPKEGNEKK